MLSNIPKEANRITIGLKMGQTNPYYDAAMSYILLLFCNDILE